MGVRVPGPVGTTSSCRMIWSTPVSSIRHLRPRRGPSSLAGTNRQAVGAGITDLHGFVVTAGAYPPPFSQRPPDAEVPPPPTAVTAPPYALWRVADATEVQWLRVAGKRAGHRLSRSGNRPAPE